MSDLFKAGLRDGFLVTVVVLAGIVLFDGHPVSVGLGAAIGLAFVRGGPLVHERVVGVEEGSS